MQNKVRYEFTSKATHKVATIWVTSVAVEYTGMAAKQTTRVEYTLIAINLLSL